MIFRLLPGNPGLISPKAIVLCLACCSVAIGEERVSRRHQADEISGGQQRLGPAAQTLHPEPASIQGRIRQVLHEVSWLESPAATIGCDDIAVGRTNSCYGDHRETGRFMLDLEYLYWHMRGADIPPLVTTSSPGTPRSDAGLLGVATTSIVLGNERFADDWQSGGRVSFGYVLDDCNHYRLQFVYTTLGDQNEAFGASSNQLAILARPFFNVDSRSEDARVLGFPEEVSGQVHVESKSQYDVYELLIQHAVSLDCDTPTSIVYGYRSAELDDSFQILDSSLALTGAISGTTVETVDRFRSRNVFHGFQAGILTSQRISRCWYVDIAGKVAFGETSHKTTIVGQSTTTNAQGGSATRSGGLLTQQSNIGTFESNSHGVLQDLSIHFRRRFTRTVAGSVGYGIHRWVDVIRAGEQIDRFLNPTQIPPGTLSGEARPTPLNAKTDFVAQGVTFGLECIW